MKGPSVSLETYSFEAEVLTVSGASPRHAQPALGSEGQFRPAEFGVVVLENELIRAAVCPELGGRLIAWRDQAAGRDLIAIPNRIETEPGGVRGRIWRHGLALGLGGLDRANSLGPVAWSIREGEGASGHAALFTFEIVIETGISVTVCWAVPEDRCEILVQAKATNRTSSPERFRPVWTLGGEWESSPNPEGVSLYAPGTDLALQVRGSVRADAGEGCQILTPGCREGLVLGPWQTTVHTLRLLPLTGLGAPSAVCSDLAIRVEGNRLVARSARPGPATVTAALDDASCHEATAEIGTGLLDTDLPRPVARVRVEQPGSSTLEWPDPRPTLTAPVTSGAAAAWDGPQPDTAEAMLLAGTLAEATAGLEGPWNAMRAESAFRVRDFATAREAWEEALNFLPENECLWWALARVQATLGEDNSQTLANAHFLSPLEPLLRVEAFLSTPIAEGREPSPLLGPLVKDPDSLLDALGRLLDLGDRESAARLSTEVLRHAEIPLVRWLLAWNLLTGARMEAEAAHHAALAAAQAPSPPLPWRRLERQAVTETVARFPDLAGAQPWLDMLA